MRLSKAWRETIQTVLVLLVIIVVILLYAVYPLYRTKAVMGRADIDQFHPDSLSFNDPGPLAGLDALVDTFRVEADGLTTLAALRITPTSSDSSRGLVLLIPDSDTNRTASVTLANGLIESGFEIVTYDQRGTGRSGATYRGDGQLEAVDLEALVAHLQIREQIRHPLIVVGFGSGAEAGLLAAREVKRIDAVLAVDPYLSSGQLLDRLADRHGLIWFPLWRTIFWFWYEIRSGYEVKYRSADDLAGVSCRTLLLVSDEMKQSDEFETLRTRSKPELLSTGAVTTDTPQLLAEIKELANAVIAK